MVIQVVNFNLEGITHEEYMGAAKEVAPAFKELSGLRSRYGYQMKKIIPMVEYIPGKIVNQWKTTLIVHSMMRF